MTGIPLDQREREELCELFLEVGPDAPTLCEGWTAHDLAAHLAVREHEPQAAVGLLVARFADYLERRQARWKAKGFEHLVETLRTPPLLWRTPGLRDLVNLNEYLVHHEDVRRPNGRGPRTDRPDLQDAAWKAVGRSAGLATRKLGDIGLVLVRPDTGERSVARKGDDPAVLTGPPVELALYLSGRREAAEVELTGPAPSVTAVTEAPFGI